MFTGWETQRWREQVLAYERSLWLRIRFAGPVLVNHEAHQGSKFLRLDESSTSSLLLFDYYDPTKKSTGIKLVDIERDKPIVHSTKPNQLTKQRLCDVQWYPFDSGLFATGHAKGNVRIWDTEQLKQVRTFELQTGCTQLAMSPVPSSHSALLAVACERGEIRLIDLFSQNFAQSLQMESGKHTSAVCWSTRDANVLASAEESGRVLIWDIRKPNHELQVLDEHNQTISSFGNSKRMRCFAHDHAVNTIRFTEQGRALLTCDDLGTIKVWRETNMLNQYRHTHLVFRRLRASADAIAVSSRTDLLFAGDGEYVKCYDGVKGGARNPLTTLAGHARRVRAIALREQHQQLYTLADDGFIVRWQFDSVSNPTATITTAQDHDDWSD
ncbi:hypothetical protein BASA81_001977 [Batrachochytrium salamandrivorans]|nr:hypothetical protein BASA81_001977 [Batrachochytrium salamandrivorans]